jgi:hypothetical protein
MSILKRSMVLVSMLGFRKRSIVRTITGLGERQGSGREEGLLGNRLA